MKFNIQAFKARKFQWALAAVALVATPVFSSCSDDEDDEIIEVSALENVSINYNADGVWSGWNEATSLEVGGIRYNHDWNPEWYVSNGFVASKVTDTAKYEVMYEHQFSVISGGGVYGEGSPYFICYWNTMETDETPFEERSARLTHVVNGQDAEFTPFTVFVNNTCYAYYAMADGDTYARKFETGDWFKLVAHGVKADGTESTTEFYLADLQKDATTGIVKRWTAWDLSKLGRVKGIYFTMESSDSGEWGMNTPSYFALDQLSYLE